MNRFIFWLLALWAVTGAGARATAETLFPPRSEWRYWKGTRAPSSPDLTAWRRPAFDDRAWLTGAGTFYYGDPFSGTLLSDMQNTYTTVFLRRTFTVAEPGDIRSLTLTAACDDGFICWINGQEAMRFNVPPGEIPHTGLASSPVNPDPAVFNEYPISDARSLLVPGDNVIAIQLLNASPGSSDIVWDASLTYEMDRDAPVILSRTPVEGAAVRDLFAVEVVFSEPVRGVDAGDLVVNGVPAAEVDELAPGQFLFTFPRQSPGTVTVAFRADHGITDLAGTPHPFAGGSWQYTVDPTLRIPGLIISEFMADNDGVLRDEDGDESDWIEIHNTTTQTLSLFGWSLTDDPEDLDRWTFPNVSVPAGGYLVVFASEKNRTAVPGRLHTNFRLSTSGEFLALVDPSGNVESAFSPSYPPQRRNVSYGRANGAPTVVGYFTEPTPGNANRTGGSGFAPAVSFSRPGGTYRTDFAITLSLSRPDPSSVIRYTLNGSMPTESSPIYSTPLPISGTVVVRARAFSPGQLPGDPRTEMYFKLEGTTPTFTSDLPVLVLHNYGRARPPAEGQQPAYLQVYEPVNGVTSLANPPALRTRAGIGARGSSTLGYPKVSLNLELRDEFEDDQDQELLGLPADSDWVLYAPNNFEPILIHNPYAHQLARDLGRYSSRTRFVEVFLITDAIGTVRYPGTYAGIYVLQERVRRSPDRVAVDRLAPENTQPPEVSGGYLLKVDRTGPGESGFYAARQGMVYVEPSEAEMLMPERAAQRQYLRTHFDAFGTALYGPNWLNPSTGYRAFIDVEAWIDYHLVNVLTFNVDALRLSAYFYKPRNGPITFGPQWDFDRALNSTDGRDANPRIWSAPGGSGTDFFNDTTQAWWGRLFQDPEFFQQWIDRYQELRGAQFATTNLWRLVDQLTDEVRRAQPREQSRWGSLAPPRGGFNGEITSLKAWLSNRVTFMDSQFVARPRTSTGGGPFSGSLSLTLTGPVNGTVYYTIDGTDPRLPGGAVSPAARVAGAAPIVLTANARLVARTQNPAHTARTGEGNPPLVSRWSGPITATFYTALPPLRISEVHYHPARPPAGSSRSDTDFEFVELVNVSNAPLLLNGFSLERGVDYTFTAASGVTELAPGGRVLVVRNRAAFLERYPGTTGIAGEFTGALANEGESLRLWGPLREPIHSFEFRPRWAPITDGVGFSLVLRNETTPPDRLGEPEVWRASARPGGSPGTADPEPAAVPPVLINEALARAAAPLMDAVELHNPGPAPVPIGGWWLSDDFRTPQKYRLPPDAVLAPGGYRVIDETELRAGDNGFSLGAGGDELYLFSADAQGTLTGWHHGFSFGASFSGVTFGRWVTSDGVEHWVPQSARTLGSANAGPSTGPLVITEIHAEPVPAGVFNNTASEFVEIRNVTGNPLPLSDPALPGEVLRLRGGVDFDFPAGAILPPGGFALVVPFDPAWPFSPEADFRSTWGVPPEVPIFGPWQGTLNNAGEQLRLDQADAPVTDPPTEAGPVPYVTLEAIDYRPAAPWPGGATGNGNSLQRRRSLVFGNEPANWAAATPTPGRLNNPDDTLGAPADADADGLPDDWERRFGLNPASGTGDDGPDGDPDRDGASNRAEYVAGTHPHDPDSVFTVTVTSGPEGVQLRFPGVSGRRYTVWSAESLTGPAWAELQSLGPVGADSLLVVNDPMGRELRFYAVTVALP